MKRKLLFDIGANHGIYTDENRSKYESCILVDANSVLIQELLKKYQNDMNVHVIHGIVSNKESETFYISNADQISTADPEWINQSRFSKSYTWAPVEGVPTISLDTLVKTYGEPDVIKIDVEGYEYNVLLSLTKKVPKLCFEWAEEKKREILLSLEYLQKLGFTKYHIQMEDEYTYEVDESAWQDFSTTYNLMNMLCEPNRKNRWGMIWAL